MEYALVINTFLEFLLVLLISIKLFKNFENGDQGVKVKVLLWVFVELLVFIIFLLWSTKLLVYSPRDLVYIWGFILMIQTPILCKFLSPSKINSFIFPVVYGLVILSLFFSFVYIFLLVAISSILLIYCSVNSIFYNMKFSALIAVIYACVALIGSIASFVYLDILVYFVIASNIVLLFLVKYLFNELKLDYTEKVTPNPKNIYFSFLKHFLFIIVFTNLVFIATLSIHEISHFLMSLIFDCVGQKIVFEAGILHTDILCQGGNNFLLIFAGVFGPMVLAGLLFISGGFIVRELSLLLVGFNLMASFKDFTELNLSITLSLSLSLFGLGFVIFGIYTLAKSRFQDPFFI